MNSVDRQQVARAALAVLTVVAIVGALAVFVVFVAPRPQHPVPGVGAVAGPTASSPAAVGTASPSTRPSRPPTPRPTGRHGGRSLADLVQGVVDSRGAAVFRVATFNLLGAGHTDARGNKPHYASGAIRAGWALQLLDRNRVDVVGLQEFQASQHYAFERLGRGWQVFPNLHSGGADLRQAVAWRTGVWKLVETRAIAIPYFNGNELMMPVVLLEHRASGAKVWFSSFHNPADTARFRRQQAWRSVAMAREKAMITELRASGYPVIVTGDMNDRERFFCTVVDSRTVVAANGGINGPGGCRPPVPTPIDWIIGTSDVVFSDYVRDVSTLVRRASDHPLYASTATVLP